jgi:hypothetical protein
MKATTFMRRLGLAAIAAVGLVASASAHAHTQSYESTITIRERDGGTRYTGRVFSDRAACEKNRTVKLFRSNGDFVGDTSTNERGRWSYVFVGQRYYVTAPRRVDGSGDHRHVCRHDRSPTTN